MNRTVLLVDDNENDVFLMHRAFKKAEFHFPVKEATNGEVAIAYLKGDGIFSDREAYPLPAMILLDLNMPKKDGFDVLAWMQARPIFSRICVVITTASTRPEDVVRAHALGATSYFIKPSAMDELVRMLRTLREFVGFNHFPPTNGMVVR